MDLLKKKAISSPSFYVTAKNTHTTHPIWSSCRFLWVRSAGIRHAIVENRKRVSRRTGTAFIGLPFGGGPCGGWDEISLERTKVFHSRLYFPPYYEGWFEGVIRIPWRYVNGEIAPAEYRNCRLAFAIGEWFRRPPMVRVWS